MSRTPCASAPRSKIGSVADPTPARGDLLLRVTGCGICGSDFKARPAIDAGVVMGHEFCGEVVAVGSDVTGTWKEGMRAAVLLVNPRRDHVIELTEVTDEQICGTIAPAGTASDIQTVPSIEGTLFVPVV